MPDVVSTERHMLTDVEPEVEVVNRALLIAHVDVKGEEVNWRGRSAIKNIVKSGMTGGR